MRYVGFPLGKVGITFVNPSHVRRIGRELSDEKKCVLLFDKEEDLIVSVSPEYAATILADAANATAGSAPLFAKINS